MKQYAEFEDELSLNEDYVTSEKHMNGTKIIVGPQCHFSSETLETIGTLIIVGGTVFLPNLKKINVLQLKFPNVKDRDYCFPNLKLGYEIQIGSDFGKIDFPELDYCRKIEAQTSCNFGKSIYIESLLIKDIEWNFSNTEIISKKQNDAIFLINSKVKMKGEKYQGIIDITNSEILCPNLKEIDTLVLRDSKGVFRQLTKVGVLVTTTYKKESEMECPQLESAVRLVTDISLSLPRLENIYETLELGRTGRIFSGEKPPYICKIEFEGPLYFEKEILTNLKLKSEDFERKCFLTCKQIHSDPKPVFYDEMEEPV